MLCFFCFEDISQKLHIMLFYFPDQKVVIWPNLASTEINKYSTIPSKEYTQTKIYEYATKQDRMNNYCGDSFQCVNTFYKGDLGFVSEYQLTFCPQTTNELAQL
jgi:hypothetical protein